ncbi:MAG TPA: hypothetical protein VIT91_13955 [Chthoniobacterales bacterium]
MKRERSTFQPATGMSRRLSIAGSTVLIAASMLAFQPLSASAATGNELLVEQLSPDDVNKPTLDCESLANAVARAVSTHQTQSPEIVAAALVRAPNFECQKQIVTIAIRSLGSKKLVREYAPQIAEAAVRATPNCATDNDVVAFDKDGKGVAAFDKGVVPFERGASRFDKGVVPFDKGIVSFDKDGKGDPALGGCACAEAFTATAIAALGGDPSVASEAFSHSAEPRFYTSTSTNDASYADADIIAAIVKSVLSAVPASCNDSVVRAAIASAPQYANQISNPERETPGPPAVPPAFLMPPPPTGGFVPEVTPVN